ncbi:hypothetical protein [Microbacterium aurum]
MTSPRPLNAAAWFAIGAAGAIVGLLPWLVTGARLPLQNLGAGSVADMPVALLPFSQYYLTSIVALLVVGSAVAGIAGRALADRRPRHGTLALAAGVLAVQLIAAVQATLVTRALLEASSRAALYTGAVIAVIVVSLLVGTLVLLLIARAPVPGAVIGLSLAALVSATWIGTAFRDLLLLLLAPYEVSQPVLTILRWIPAVLVGAAIAWGGFRTAGRVAASVVSLAALWIGPAFFTAVANAAGTRVLAAYPAEMAEFGVGVFFQALTIPEVVLPPLVVAAAIGVAGAAAGALWRRHRSAANAPAAPAAAGDLGAL